MPLSTRWWPIINVEIESLTQANWPAGDGTKTRAESKLFHPHAKSVRRPYGDFIDWLPQLRWPDIFFQHAPFRWNARMLHQSFFVSFWSVKSECKSPSENLAVERYNKIYALKCKFFSGNWIVCRYFSPSNAIMYHFIIPVPDAIKVVFIVIK